MTAGPTLGRQESIDPSVDYDLIVKAMDLLYIPTNNYKKVLGSDGSVYIKKNNGP